MMGSISKGAGGSVKQFAHGWKGMSSLEAVQTLQRQPRVVQVLEFLCLFGLIAGLDHVIDHDLSLFALYLIPTLYAAWFLGIRWGYVSCLASGVVWAIEDWGDAVFYHYPLIPYWNVAGRLIVLTFIVAMVSAMRGRLKMNMNMKLNGEAPRKNSKLPAKCRHVCFRRRPRIIPDWTSVSSTSRPVKWVATTMISFRSIQPKWVLPSRTFLEKDSPALC